MWAAKEIGGWVVDPSEGESTLSKEPGLGNVVLSYLQRFDPDQAARVMDEMWNANALVARQTDTNGISYFITHSHRTYGDRDFAVNADIPTASAYCNADGRYTYVVYNADAAERVVTFFKDGVKMTQFKAPAHRLTVYGEVPRASSIEIAAPAKTVGAGSDTQFAAVVCDQYGATVDAAEIAWSTTYGTIDSDGTLHAPSAKGSATITAVCGALSASVDVRVDAVPALKSVKLLPEMDYAIAGQTVEFSLSAVDQYGDAFPVAHTWTIERDGKVVKSDSILNLKEAGVYTVKAIAGAKTYSHRIFMTPQMPNLAIGAVVTASSEENAGTHKENAVDGDRTTRWSSAASDDQWIAVDLGKEAYVNSVNIVWENAYASLYDVQTSADGKQWTTVKTVAGGGGVEQTIVGASARHIRIACRSRATIDGEGILTPVAEGECVVTAQSGTAVDRRTVRVLSTLVPSALRISPAYMEIEEGTAVDVAVLAADQYGLPVAAAAAKWTVPEGMSVDGGKLVANAAGTYVVAAEAFSLKAEAEVKVLPRLTDNIALKKAVTASDGSTVAALNDGNGGSRWIANGETVDLTMDLGGVYHLMRSSILWERAAAADYTVAVSLDGENWQPMSATEGLSDTGVDRTDETTVNGIARYVRLSMTRKATQWAYSIYEWQLYGRRMLAGEPCSVAILPHAGETSVGVGVEFEAEVKDCDGNEVTSAPRLWTATGGVFAGGTYSSEIAGLFGIACESMLAKAMSQIEVICPTSVITTTCVDSRIYLDGGSLVVESDGLTGVTVFAADGRVAMRSDARGDALRCQLALPHGVYVVFVATTSGHRVTKIVL